MYRMNLYRLIDNLIYQKFYLKINYFYLLIIKIKKNHVFKRRLIFITFFAHVCHTFLKSFAFFL